MRGSKSKKIFEILGRKKIIIGFIILIILLTILTISLVVGAVKENKENKITYTESSLVGYKVYLKENDFFEQKYLKENKQYIASLIDYVYADFTYELKSSEPDNDYNCTYKIVAETNVEDKTNQNSIYKITEDLVEEKTLKFNSDSKLKINKEISIDYNKYNNIIKEFISVYNLNDINSTVTIKMYVNVEGVTSKADYDNTPVASLVIPLTTRTVAIDIESNSVNATDMSIYKEIARKNYLYIAVLTGALTAMIIIELCIFIDNTKDEKALYKTRIKRILLNYDSYIQKINNDFNFEGYQQLEMKTFEDLLQVRDTISQPILMIEKRKEVETDFIIPSKEKVIYIYKLRVKDIRKEKREREEQRTLTKEEIKI